MNAQLTLEEKTEFLKLAANNNWWLFFYHDPNTAAVKLEYDNGIRKEFNMRSDFESNGIIRLIHKN